MSKKKAARVLDCKYFEAKECCINCGTKCIRTGKFNPCGREYKVCCKTLLSIIGQNKSRPLTLCYVNRWWET